MILIGMFDSPFVRRVAISMTQLSVPFEHRNWSVGRDAARIREFNPLARVPTLVLDSGESLIESAMILDYLDQQAGEARALLPSSGEARSRALSLIALATGAADKGIQTVYERIFRPPEKNYAPWTQRCLSQMHAALAELETRSSARPANDWLLGDKLSQADITLTCYITYLSEAVPFGLAAYPALFAHVERCEALPVFQQFYVPFDPPDPDAWNVKS